MKIEFRIITRGTMLVYYGDKTAIIQGEATFEPLMFYAWIDSFTHWESPYENSPITEEEKREIIDYIVSHSQKIKVIFD
jgi:hypothetical protein